MDQLENAHADGLGARHAHDGHGDPAAARQRQITGKEAYKKAINKSRFEQFSEASAEPPGLRRICGARRRRGIICGHAQCDAAFSSPAPCPTPTARCTSATSSRPCRPTSGCGSRSCAATSAITSCADDTHGTPIMLKAQAEGITPGGADRAGEPRASARSRRHADRLRQLRLDAFAENQAHVHRDVPAHARARLHREAHHPPGLRRRARSMFLPDRYVQGHLPELRHGGPVRRLLRGLRRHLHAGGAEESDFRGQRHAAGVRANRSIISSV